jgi:hypothetical protein
MNNRDECKNCGGDYGLHHYRTLQCPRKRILEAHTAAQAAEEQR